MSQILYLYTNVYIVEKRLKMKAKEGNDGVLTPIASIQCEGENEGKGR